jgi:peptidoglycan-associated lipoprotein
MNKTIRVALVALLCVGAAACQKKQEVKDHPDSGSHV